MKRYIASGTNSVNVPARTNVIEAADDEVSETLDDKIKAIEDDFDYIISGLDQLDLVQANDMVNQIDETLQNFISDIANQLS